MEMPYNESCDVYSWGILYWQVCSLQTPFANYSTRQHAEKVVHGGQRPTPDKSWPAPWRELQEECWKTFAGLRPTMAQVLEQVTSFGQALGGGADDDVDVVDVENGGVETSGLVLQESTDTSRIKAKKKKKAIADDHLDADTRLGHNGHHGPVPVFVKEGSDLV